MGHKPTILKFRRVYGIVADVVESLYVGGVKTVNSRLKLLVAEREMRERRSLSIRTITAESGASRSTVERLLNITMRRVPLDDLAALWTYIDCDVSDILRAEIAPQPTTGGQGAEYVT